MATESLKPFYDAIRTAHFASSDPFDTLQELARAHAGLLGESDRLARVTLALAIEFDQASGTETRRDPIALARLAEAYVRARDELLSGSEADINLPYLAATDEGPKHLCCTLTARRLDELAARDPHAAPTRPFVAAPHPKVEKPRKKGWWPF